MLKMRAGVGDCRDRMQEMRCWRLNAGDGMLEVGYQRWNTRYRMLEMGCLRWDAGDGQHEINSSTLQTNC